MEAPELKPLSCLVIFAQGRDSTSDFFSLLFCFSLVFWTALRWILQCLSSRTAASGRTGWHCSSLSCSIPQARPGQKAKSTEPEMLQPTASMSSAVISRPLIWTIPARSPADREISTGGRRQTPSSLGLLTHALGCRASSCVGKDYPTIPGLFVPVRFVQLAISYLVIVYCQVCPFLFHLWVNLFLHFYLLIFFPYW